MAAHLEARPVETFAAETKDRQQKLRRCTSTRSPCCRITSACWRSRRPRAAWRAARRGDRACAAPACARQRRRARAHGRAPEPRRAGQVVGAAAEERENMNEAKARTQLGNTQQVKAEVERARQKCEQLEATLQALEARNTGDRCAAGLAQRCPRAARCRAGRAAPAAGAARRRAAAHSGNDELQARAGTGEASARRAKSSAAHARDSKRGAAVRPSPFSPCTLAAPRPHAPPRPPPGPPPHRSHTCVCDRLHSSPPLRGLPSLEAEQKAQREEAHAERMRTKLSEMHQKMQQREEFAGERRSCRARVATRWEDSSASRARRARSSARRSRCVLCSLTLPHFPFTRREAHSRACFCA